MIRSNLQVKNQVANGDFLVTNWFARTNMLTAPAEFFAYASSTIVSLHVNYGQVRETPLSELLRRDHVEPTLMSIE